MRMRLVFIGKDRNKETEGENVEISTKDKKAATGSLLSVFHDQYGKMMLSALILFADNCRDIFH